MVTTSLRRGSTTLASFQKLSSVGCASGSDSTPLRISASLTRRSRFQSVPRLALDVFPEAAPFMRFCSPRRDDAPLMIVPIGVNNNVNMALGLHHKREGGTRRPRRALDFAP